jgi:putative ABC transport system ATP-binding protein
MSLFNVENIKVQKDTTVIFENLSFDIKQKQCFVIAGDNGSGKSTLLKMFNRLEEPSKGLIKYLGKNIASYDINKLRQQIAMVMQGPILPEGKVEDFFKTVCKTLNIIFDFEQAVKNIGLKTDILHKQTEKLSGGETQLIALSIVLAKEPKVLLLDEITAALSVQMTELVRNTIKTQIQKGISVIMVSHRKSEILTLGNEGIILDGKTSQYFSHIESLVENLKVK